MADVGWWAIWVAVQQAGMIMRPSASSASVPIIPHSRTGLDSQNQIVHLFQKSQLWSTAAGRQALGTTCYLQPTPATIDSQTDQTCPP